MIERIAAIVRADVVIRFRRLSTLVIFLLLSATVFWWVPDPATGKTLMQINGARVLYNSAAIGMATALLASLFVGLFGFYVVSNAVRRDITSRCGFVAASTTMRSGEYLFGKFAGNVVFLATFIGGYMIASMAMLVVRSEAPLEPLIFAKQYLILVPSTIAFVSVIAILFEAIPWLSGRFGDVLYFFLWASAVGVVVSAIEHGVTWARWFDFNGLGYLLVFSKTVWHTTHLSIGQSSFDVAKPPLVIEGLTLTGDWFFVRLVATLTPLPLLGVAMLFFHRFDPARVRASHTKERRGWIARINRLTKPLVRPFIALAMRGGSQPSLMRAAISDAMITIASTPLIGIAFIAMTIATLARSDVLIVAFAAAGIFIADISTRERRAGTTTLVYSAPMLQPRFVAWKLAASIVVALSALAPSIARAAFTNPRAAMGIVVAMIFICAAATALGVISGNPKTFIVVYLSLWYVAVNDKGATPALDFAGFYHAPSMSVIASYFTASVALIAAAEFMHRRILRRA